ncbi:hypothetical protein HOY80DRAFT_1067947 [Tuber brumale]|nr:hypothetical protein HOY80DRAFT_1067947 [Tuber brumale]
MPYKFHPYSVLAKRGHKTEPGKLLFAELTALYAEHKEHIKPMEPTWYERIKQMDAEREKLYHETNAEREKLYWQLLKLTKGTMDLKIALHTQIVVNYIQNNRL